MSRSDPPTFGSVSNPFGQISEVDDYQPPVVSPTDWQQPSIQEDTMEDDEPFTVAHLSTAPDSTVPAVSPTAHQPNQVPFRESVAPREVSGRMGPPPAAALPVTTQSTASLLGGRPQSSSAEVGLGTVEDPRSYPFYNIKRYRTYFNVDTADVLHRIFRAMVLFFKGDFLEHVSDNPDLYGPFWIASTLVFVSAAAGNYASYLAYNRTHPEEQHHEGWYYDVDKVGGSMGLFYGYVGLMGVAVWLALRWFQAGVELAQVWCTYGYAMAMYVPMAVLCVLPMDAVRWALVGGATVASGLFLLLNFRGPVLGVAGAKAAPLLLVMIAVHGALGLALKLYFFQY